MTFSEHNLQEIVMITIVDDDFLEGNEQFVCSLVLINNTDPSVQLRPSIAIVNIIDDDRKLSTLQQYVLFTRLWIHSV